MKIVRPEQPIKPKEEKRHELIEEHTKICQEEKLFLNDIEVLPIPETAIEVINEPQTIEDVMNAVLEETSNKISFTVTLTKRQYELYLQKGGESWLKKALVGQVKKKKKSK